MKKLLFLLFLLLANSLTHTKFPEGCERMSKNECAKLPGHIKSDEKYCNKEKDSGQTVAGNICCCEYEDFSEVI